MLRAAQANLVTAAAERVLAACRAATAGATDDIAAAGEGGDKRAGGGGSPSGQRLLQEDVTELWRLSGAAGGGARRGRCCVGGDPAGGPLRGGHPGRCCAGRGAAGGAPPGGPPRALLRWGGERRGPPSGATLAEQVCARTKSRGCCAACQGPRVMHTVFELSAGPEGAACGPAGPHDTARAALYLLARQLKARLHLLRKECLKRSTSQMFEPTKTTGVKPVSYRSCGALHGAGLPRSGSECRPRARWARRRT